MITFDIIRGHKLILWSRRLDFKEDFITALDPAGTAYIVAKEKTDEDEYTVVLLVKVRGRDDPFPIVFKCNESMITSLVEKVQIEI